MNNKTKLEKLKNSMMKSRLPLMEQSPLVWSRGSDTPKVVFIGEALGKNEVIQGMPFVGRAGQILQEMIEHIGLTGDEYYITNVVKCRPPKNRDPTKEEIKAHSPFLLEELKILQPKVVVPLGNHATKIVLSDFEPDRMKEIEGINKHTFKVYNKEFSNLVETKVVPSLHPAYVCYNSSKKNEIKRIFELIREVVNEK